MDVQALLALATHVSSTELTEGLMILPKKLCCVREDKSLVEHARTFLTPSTPNWTESKTWSQKQSFRDNLGFNNLQYGS